MSRVWFCLRTIRDKIDKRFTINQKFGVGTLTNYDKVVVDDLWQLALICSEWSAAYELSFDGNENSDFVFLAVLWLSIGE